MRRNLVICAVLTVLLAGCDWPYFIDTPTEGQIVETTSVVVTGDLDQANPGGTLLVDGVATPINPDHTWSATVSVPTDQWIKVIDVTYTDPSGFVWRQRRAIVHGQALDAGEYSNDGVGLNFTNAGLASLGPVIEDLAAGSFDIEGQLMSSNPAIDTTISGLGVVGNVYEAGMDGVGLTTAATASGMKTTITIQDMFIGLDLDIDIVSDCKLEIQIDSATIQGYFDLQPSPTDPTYVDVNITGDPTVTLSGFSKQFISGACDPDAPIIGPIVNGLAGDSIAPAVTDAFQDQLGDPDGSGPGDSPIADAVEDALSGLHIAGDVGAALGVNLAAPFTAITESANGISLKSNADFYATIGSGPNDCAAVPGAPSIPSTVDLANSFPTLGSTTPSGDPYGIGMVISASAFNQLLGAMAECGSFNQTLTELNLPPFGTVPLTAGVLAALEPTLSRFAPSTPMQLRITPTGAPFLTDDPGPNGEMATLLIPDIQIDFIVPGNDPELALRVNLDAPLGFDLDYDAVNNVLVPTITAGPPGSVDARVTYNVNNANNTNVETLFESIFPIFAADLGASFGAFPLPSFLGLQLSVVDVVRTGNTFVLYSNIAAVPQTRLTNVTLQDFSSADYEEDDAASDSQLWRHRIRRQTTSTSISTQFQSSIGADAATIFDDESIDKTGDYKIGFTVVPENGDTWRLDLAQQYNGAHTHVGEGNRATTEYRNPSGFSSPFVGRYRLNGGAWVYFNFTVSPTSKSTLESNANVGVSGSNSAVITGTTQTGVEVEYFMRQYALSDSNGNPFGDYGDGSEGAIRSGLNDTLTNGFTAGEYPGQGNRVAANDGHFATVVLSVL